MGAYTVERAPIHIADFVAPLMRTPRTTAVAPSPSTMRPLHGRTAVPCLRGSPPCMMTLAPAMPLKSYPAWLHPDVSKAPAYEIRDSHSAHAF